MKLVIVGGVAGGASAAARARRVSEDAEIILFERGPDVSFANCGLPYHIGGEIAQRDKLLITTPERLHARFNLDVRVRTSVESIDRNRKLVHVRNLATGQEYDESYDKLILSPGASPIRPNLPGIDLPGIYTLRNLNDMDRILQTIHNGVTHAVIIGAGFIGLELAENLVKRGINTSVVELQDQVLPPLDKEMAVPIADKLREKGVTLFLNQSAEAFEQANDQLTVRLNSGHSLQAQLVIVGVGVRPDNHLAVEAGLEISQRGGIRVDEFLQTSDPDIYAAGDAIEVRDFVTGEHTQLPLAGPANRQGRIAADNAFGRKQRFRGSQGTAIVGVFDRIAALTGASEKTLRRLSRSHRKIYVHPANHAGYYPGAEGMTLKVLFEPFTGKLLGAQAIGGTGVDKRIDVISVAIQAGMTVFDLEEMELAYAPQFGSAKDPVNMAGFVAAGLVKDDHPQVDVEYVLEHQSFMLDVRTPTEFDAGHIPNAVNIPVDDLRSRLAEVPSDRQIAVYCQVGQRGYIATRILRQHGFNAVNISGGYRTYLLVSAVQHIH